MTAARRLTDFASCAGCAGKITPQGITRLLDRLPRLTDANVIVGTETHDDAGVYRLTDEIALVQTIDFFPPLLDDPYVYGQIAAANALSDVYAMGGEPKTVLNLVGYPDDELGDVDWLARILEGGAERCAAAGAVVLGGHSVRDAEIKFGMSVTGVVHPQKVWTNAGARPGDVLVLTKPLGAGFVTSAARKDACPPEVLAAACASMIQLNQIGRDSALAAGGVHAVTDVTGFGLCGHGYEMAEGSGVTLAIDLRQLPVIPGVEEHLLTRLRTRASRTNADYVKAQSRFEGTPDPVRTEFLWDPQTSGGLLVSIERKNAGRLVEELQQRGAAAAAVIGEVLERRDAALIFRS
jgi:selenide,water dikinase